MNEKWLIEKLDEFDNITLWGTSGYAGDIKQEILAANRFWIPVSEGLPLVPDDKNYIRLLIRYASGRWEGGILNDVN